MLRPTTIFMVRPTLDNIPDWALPAGFSIRFHRPGDEADWLAIQRVCDLINEFPDSAFFDKFGRDPVEHSRRILYLESDGRLIGTAAAWWASPPFSSDLGRIHWVAILPQCQGRGLAKPLLSAALERLRELGAKGAYLQTDTRRTVAVALYRKYGFEIIPRP